MAEAARKVAHHIGDPVVVNARLTDAQRAELKGVKVTYEVVRDGRTIYRSGNIGRIDGQYLWISGWCYFVEGEVRNLRRA